MPDQPGGLGRVKNPMTPVAAALYPVTRRLDFQATAATYRYWYQGTFLDQGSEGTCVGFTFAHRRADSPVPVSGISREYARQLYLDASGDTSYQNGTSGYAACRELAERGTISAYHWITTGQELRTAILTMGTVCIGTDWYNSMFYPVSKYSNKYLNVDQGSGLAGGHEYLVNGINLFPSSGPAFYRIKNSWGTGWGKGGTARVACNVLEDLIFNRGGDAVIITESPA